MIRIISRSTIVLALLASSFAASWAPPPRRVKLSRHRIDLLRTALDKMPQGDTGSTDSAEGRQRQQQVVHTMKARRSPLPRPLKGLGPLASVREALPVARARKKILQALRHPVSLIEGDTGCGKSTQVAQFLLEEAAMSGCHIGIACTQPRRISAIGVAERIAAERGETVGRGAVGYGVRGEARQSPRGNALLVCTVGVLLRILEEDPLLSRFDVILVDEVHERSVENDFMLMALREVQLRRNRRKPGQRRQGQRRRPTDARAPAHRRSHRRTDVLPPLRIGLMSASMESFDLFEQYFAQRLQLRTLPRVRLQGRTYPVATRYLEHAILATQHVVIPTAPWCLQSQAARRRAAASENPDRVALMPQTKWKERFPSADASLLDALRLLDTTAVNVDLILQLVRRFLQHGRQMDRADAGATVTAAPREESRSDSDQYGGGDGGEDDRSGCVLPREGCVLVFLPGSAEIEEVRRVLLGVLETPGGRVHPDWVLALHGALSPQEQARVFQSPPDGVTKIVLATNVAETSVTIDDVVLVIDTGRVKRVTYDPASRISQLEDVCISQAEARQRRGRAGRVRAGLCYHLFPSDATLAPTTAPEVLRVSLESAVMASKGLQMEGTATALLATLPTPPPADAVEAAVGELRALGAIDESEALTPLGRLLTQIPIAPQLAKLVVLGVAFGAVDETLTIAASLARRPPFLTPIDATERRVVTESKARLAGASQSDHLAALNAYAAYYYETPAGLGDPRARLAAARSLSAKMLHEIRVLKSELVDSLGDAGLLTRRMRSLGAVEARGRRAAVAGSADPGSDGTQGVSDQLLAALIGAALYPRFAYTRSYSSDGRVLSASQLELHMRRLEDPASAPSAQAPCDSGRLHPGCSGSRLNGTGWISPYLSYHECIETTDAFLRGVTPVPPLAVLLFCGHTISRMPAEDGGERTILDGWLSLDASETAAELVVQARERVASRLAQVVSEALSSNGQRGRFSGQPLLDAVQPLLEQRVLPEQPLKVKGSLKRGKMKAKGCATSRSASGGNDKQQPAQAQRKPRKRLAKYRYGRRRG